MATNNLAPELRVAERDVPYALVQLSGVSGNSLSRSTRHHDAVIQLAGQIAAQSEDVLGTGVANQSPIDVAREATGKDRALRFPVVAFADYVKGRTNG